MYLDETNVGGSVYKLHDTEARAMTSDEYDQSKSYAVGDYCIYENALYKCTAAATGVWDATKWKKTAVGTELREQNVKIKPIHTITVELQFDSTGIAQYTFDHNVVILNVTGMAGDYAKQITYGRTEGFTMWSFISDPNTNIAVDMAYIDF